MIKSLDPKFVIEFLSRQFNLNGKVLYKFCLRPPLAGLTPLAATLLRRSGPSGGFCSSKIRVEKTKHSLLHRSLSLFLVLAFSSSLVVPPGSLYAQSILSLPAAGTMISLSPSFTPILVRGITIDPTNPLKLSFIVDSGNEKLTDNEFKNESERLIKYFFACLTVPEKDMWVNLSPHEKGRIIPNEFGITDAGRDLLAQDYILKQLTASLIYPEDELGKKFWDRVYKIAYEQYGTTNIPVNTFNKVWIIPDKALVVESGQTAFVAKSHLKVMLEEDYMGLNSNLNNKDKGADQLKAEDFKNVSTVSSKVIKEIILPAIEKEVNEGKNFAALRQINQSMILATWYKRNLKESLLGKVYIDQNKVKGVDLEDKTQKEQIYQQYLQAIQKGVYNYIREDYDPNTQETLQRKYFAGGFQSQHAEIDAAMSVEDAVNKNLITSDDVRLIGLTVMNVDAAVVELRNDEGLSILKPLAERSANSAVFAQNKAAAGPTTLDAAVTVSEAIPQLKSFEEKFAKSNGNSEVIKQVADWLIAAGPLNDDKKSFATPGDYSNFMVRKSILARDTAGQMLGAEYETLRKEVMEKTFAQMKKTLGNTEQGQATYRDTTNLIQEWLDPRNGFPPFRIQGIYRAMLEQRIDDIIDFFQMWREFGTAGIRGNAVGSKYGDVLKQEGKEFVADPQAPILSGPNGIDAEVLLQQVAAVSAITKELRDKLVNDSQHAMVRNLDDDTKERLKNNRVAIAYDSRLNGEYFAKIISGAFLLNGLKVDFFDSPSGVPGLVWAANAEGLEALEGGSAWGLLISASHSEWFANGFKAFFATLLAQVDQTNKKRIVDARDNLKYSDLHLDLLQGTTAEVMSRIDQIFKDSDGTNGKGELRWIGRAEPQPGKDYFGKKIVDFYKWYFDKVRSRFPSVKYLSEKEQEEVQKAKEKIVIRYSAFYGVGAEKIQTFQNGQEVDIEGVNFPKFFRDAGYKNLRIVDKQTKYMDGTFPSHPKQPDPGDITGWISNALDTLIQEAGEDLVDIEKAINRINEEDLWLGTDPDVDRAGMALALPEGVKGNLKVRLLAFVENYLNTRKIQDTEKTRILAAIQNKMNDKLLLTANDAWQFITYHTLAKMEKTGNLKKDKVYFILKSHVTTSGLERVAKKYRDQGYKIYVIDTWVGFTEIGAAARKVFDIAKNVADILDTKEQAGQVRSSLNEMKKTLMELKKVTPLETPNVDDKGERDTFYALVEKTISLIERKYLNQGQSLSQAEEGILTDNLMALSNAENISGVEESNGFGQMGYYDPIQKKVMDKHIYDKDGGLGAAIFLDLCTQGMAKETPQTPYEMYQEMGKELGQVVTVNLQIRYPGFEGRNQKFDALEISEKLLTVKLQQALDVDKTDALFSGRYRVNDVMVFRAGKYDNNYRGLPEEGVRFMVDVLDEQGASLGDAIVTYRPSGTGDSNRSYNWYLSVPPKEGEDWEGYRDRSNKITSNMNKYFWGIEADIDNDFSNKEVENYAEKDEKSFMGLLLSLKQEHKKGYKENKSVDDAFAAMRLAIGKALGQNEPLTLKAHEEELLKAVKAYTFADRKHAWSSMKLKDRNDDIDKLMNARAVNRKAWDRYLKDDETKKNLQAIREAGKEKTNIVSVQIGKNIKFQVPKAIALGFKAGLVDYIATLMEENGLSDNDVTSNDEELTILLGDRLKEGWSTQSAISVQGRKAIDLQSVREGKIQLRAEDVEDKGEPVYFEIDEDDSGNILLTAVSKGANKVIIEDKSSGAFQNTKNDINISYAREGNKLTITNTSTNSIFEYHQSIAPNTISVFLKESEAQSNSISQIKKALEDNSYFKEALSGKLADGLAKAQYILGGIWTQMDVYEVVDFLKNKEGATNFYKHQLITQQRGAKGIFGATMSNEQLKNFTRVITARVSEDEAAKGPDAAMAAHVTTFEQRVANYEKFLQEQQEEQGRFLLRDHTAEQVAAYQPDYQRVFAIANAMAQKFNSKLRSLFRNSKAINTIGPSNNVQAESMIRTKTMNKVPLTKQNLLDAVENLSDIDGLWQSLIDNGYIDASGEIQEKFIQLNNHGEMVLDPRFDAKKNFIYLTMLRSVWKSIEALYLGGWDAQMKEGRSDQARDQHGYLGKLAAEISTLFTRHSRAQNVAISQMTKEERAKFKPVDFFTPLFVDFDEGHLKIKEMVQTVMTMGEEESLISAIHIEDQVHGSKKCGHMSGKVLQSTADWISTLNNARYQLDTMGLDTMIVARTDAEAAEWITGTLDGRDQRFLFGSGVTDIQKAKTDYLTSLDKQKQSGKKKDAEIKRLQKAVDTILSIVQNEIKAKDSLMPSYHEIIEAARARKLTGQEIQDVHTAWKGMAGLTTIDKAIENAIQNATSPVGMTVEEWRDFVKSIPAQKDVNFFNELISKAKEKGINVLNTVQWRTLQEHAPEALKTGINILWDFNLTSTVEDRTVWMINSGLEMAKARSIAAMPYADISWMEQHHPHIGEVREWAEAIDQAALKLLSEKFYDQIFKDVEKRQRDYDKTRNMNILESYLTQRITNPNAYLEAIKALQTNHATEKQAKLLLEAVTRLKANNTSPSFYWPDAKNEDGTKLMTKDEKKNFLNEQGKYSQFNFVTYGGSVMVHVLTQEFMQKYQDLGIEALSILQELGRLLGNAFTENPQNFAGTVAQALADAAGRGVPTIFAARGGAGDTMSQFAKFTIVEAKTLVDHLFSNEGFLDYLRGHSGHKLEREELEKVKEYFAEIFLDLDGKEGNESVADTNYSKDLIISGLTPSEKDVTNISEEKQNVYNNLVTRALRSDAAVVVQVRYDHQVGELRKTFPDVYTPEVMGGVENLAPLNGGIEVLRKKRLEGREERDAIGREIMQKRKDGFYGTGANFRKEEYLKNKRAAQLKFLSVDGKIEGADIRVEDARDGNFIGSSILRKLLIQWVQLTGPAVKPKDLEGLARGIAKGWKIEGVDINRAKDIAMGFMERVKKGERIEKIQPQSYLEWVALGIIGDLRNVAHQLLSGADAIMEDLEDAAGQLNLMSLDNQRSLKLAVSRDPLFMEVARGIMAEYKQTGELRIDGKLMGQGELTDEEWGKWQKQLDFTLQIVRARGLHLDDRHLKLEDGTFLSASIADSAEFWTNNFKTYLDKELPMVQYLPKIQTAEEAAYWDKILENLELYLMTLDERAYIGMLKTYVLVEQHNQVFQLAEIRAALSQGGTKAEIVELMKEKNRFVSVNGYQERQKEAALQDEAFLKSVKDRLVQYGMADAQAEKRSKTIVKEKQSRFVGFNTGRWDYINSVADENAWDEDMILPNIEEITMTYPFMAAYEKRVFQIVNMPDLKGQRALWQGGMETQIPVGSPEAIESAMKKAEIAATREMNEGAEGKWAAHPKMVDVLRKVWEKVGNAFIRDIQSKATPPNYTQADEDALRSLDPDPVKSPITIRGARNLISVAIQMGNAHLRGLQAAALKPADYFESLLVEDVDAKWKKGDFLKAANGNSDLALSRYKTALADAQVAQVELMKNEGLFLGKEAEYLKAKEDALKKAQEQRMNLYLMEDMATGEIRLSILWSWIHKNAKLTVGDETLGLKAGNAFTKELFLKLLDEEYKKLQGASPKNVHAASKATTLPIARYIAEQYVLNEKKIPWYIDMLNIALDQDTETGIKNVDRYTKQYNENGARLTLNPVFETKDSTDAAMVVDVPKEKDKIEDALKLWGFEGILTSKDVSQQWQNVKTTNQLVEVIGLVIEEIEAQRLETIAQWKTPVGNLNDEKEAARLILFKYTVGTLDENKLKNIETQEDLIQSIKDQIFVIVDQKRTWDVGNQNEPREDFDRAMEELTKQVKRLERKILYIPKVYDEPSNVLKAQAQELTRVIAARVLEEAVKVPDAAVTVLYVDDDSFNTDYYPGLIKDELNKYNIKPEEVTFITAVDGVDGLTKLKQNPSISLIISDVTMEGMGGLEFTKQVSELGFNIPTYLYTGNTSEDAKEEIASHIAQYKLNGVIFKGSNPVEALGLLTAPIREAIEAAKAEVQDSAIPISPEYGGIDLNSANLDLQIKRDGNGIPLPLNLQPIESMHIEGFIPVIINITPIKDLPLILGVKNLPVTTGNNSLGLNNAGLPSPAKEEKISYAALREEELSLARD